ncbi:Chaperone surA [Gossypium australe]|uniref:Chaperone surA n=1 Tax=Gossypium australe TaxID=47621 RepID=A0A5B6VPB6_9ROSI|nr:Chaperone surA [Gossypium australe]
MPKSIFKILGTAMKFPDLREECSVMEELETLVSTEWESNFVEGPLENTLGSKPLKDEQGKENMALMEANLKDSVQPSWFEPLELEAQEYTQLKLPIKEPPKLKLKVNLANCFGVGCWQVWARNKARKCPYFVHTSRHTGVLKSSNQARVESEEAESTAQASIQQAISSSSRRPVSKSRGEEAKEVFFQMINEWFTEYLRTNPAVQQSPPPAPQPVPEMPQGAESVRIGKPPVDKI